MSKFLEKLPFANHSWFLYLQLLVRHFLADNCTQKAASLTYTTLLSIVPIIAVVVTIFSTVPVFEGVREQMQQAIYSNLLPSSSSQISNYLSDFATKAVRVSVVGVGALLFTTIMTLITIETAFNQIWRVEEKSGDLNSIVRFLVMVIALPLVLAIAFLASSAIQSIDFLNRQIGGYGIDWRIWAQIFSFVITATGFVGMYWFIPKVKVPIKNAVIAGIVIAVLFECVKRVFGLAVSNFTSYEAVYGAFAALPIFLMWIYTAWNLILLGVEISYTLTVFDIKEVPVRHPLFSLLDMLNLIYKNYHAQKSTSEKELREVLGRKELPKWQAYITQLQQNNLITQLENEEYTLKTKLDSINFWEFYKTLPYSLPIKDELLHLRQAEYDPWYVEIYERLSTVEKSAKTELNMSLAYLFDNAPLRPKKEPDWLTYHNEHRVDDMGAEQASFEQNAAKTQTDDNQDILIPKGVEVWFEKDEKAGRYTKAARQFILKGKETAKGIKEKFK